MKYIDAFYRTHCKVSNKVQPHFWDAVATICETPECDITTIGLIEGENYCIDDYPVCKYVPTGNVVSYAIQIVTEIIKAESISMEDATFELFLIKKRLEVLKANLGNINSRYTLECF